MKNEDCSYKLSEFLWYEMGLEMDDLYIVGVAPIFRINLKPEQYPLCTHTAVASGTVA